MDMVHFIPPAQRKFAVLASQADTAPVLILGGSGSGKGAIAKWIHANSIRAAKPFVTGRADRGLAEQVLEAQGGTLLIPEIASLTRSDQKLLLEFFETRTVPHPENPGLRRLVNTRIMATTSHPLENRAAGDLFNAKLLQKLNVFRIDMPELSERTAEFEDIVTGLLHEITRDLKKDHLRGVSSEAWATLKSYGWPGNLRELRNVLRVAAITAQGDRIEATDLPSFGYDRVDFRATRDEFERTYILELLKAFNYEIDKTCEASHISRDVLLGKIKKLGIAVSSPTANP